MYEMFRQAGVSLLAIVILILLLAPSAMAIDRDRIDQEVAVGMDVIAKDGGGVIGNIDDVRGGEVVIELDNDREITVPRSSLRVHDGYVMYEGSRRDLLKRDRHRSDRGDIVGMDVRVRGGGTVGTVEDVVRAPGGRGWDVVIDLRDGGEVTVPKSRLTVGQNHVMFHGSRDDLNDTRRGYYRDRNRDRDYDSRYRDYDRDRYRDRDDYRDRNEPGFGDIIDQFLN